MGRRRSPLRLRARSRRGLAARPSPGDAGNSCGGVLRQRAQFSTGTCAGGGGAGRGGESWRARGKGRGARSCGGGSGGGRLHPGGPARKWTRGFANGLSCSRSGSSSALAARTAPRARLLRGAEVDRGRCLQLAGAPIATHPHTGTTGPASLPQFSFASCLGLRRIAVSWRFWHWSAGRGWLRMGDTAILCMWGPGSGPLCLHPSCLPAAQISALAASRRCQGKRSASRSAAKAQQARASGVLADAASWGPAPGPTYNLLVPLLGLPERSWLCLH